MAQRVFLLNKLREGADPASYERWVREVGYPFVSRIPSVRAYVVTRLDGRLDGGETPAYDFLEVVDVTDLDAYEADLSTDRPEIQGFDEEWLSYIGEAILVYGEVVE